MRKLKTTDVFDFVRLLKKLNMKEEIKKLYKEAQEQKIDTTQEEFGIEVVFTLIEKFSEKNAEHELYNFFAKPFEMTPEEVEKLDLDILIDNFKKLAGENNLQVFFNSAGRLLQK